MVKNPEMSDTGKNWNVVTGCTRYSDGCKNCYAESVVEWLAGMGQQHYIDNGFSVVTREDRLDFPLTLAKKPKRPARIFVTDMGDLFHDEVPSEFIVRVFDVMQKVPQHRFYVLTKRSKRLATLGKRLEWQPWIWVGVTVESKKYVNRIKHLQSVPADNRFILFEPLLSDVPNLDLSGIGWVVVGGETKKDCTFRVMEKNWVINIRDQAVAAGIPFLFKHWAGKTHNSAPAILNGKEWGQYPKSILR